MWGGTITQFLSGFYNFLSEVKLRGSMKSIDVGADEARGLRLGPLHLLHSVFSSEDLM